jgi:predicted glycosyltransferase
MALYDAAHRVCKMKDQEVKLSSDLKQNFSSNVFCGEISKKLPASSSHLGIPFVSFLKAKFENISNCEQACLQDKLINPICRYILAANLFTVTNNEGELPFIFCDCYTCAGFYPCLSCCLLDCI